MWARVGAAPSKPENQSVSLSSDILLGGCAHSVARGNHWLLRRMLRARAPPPIRSRARVFCNVLAFWQSIPERPTHPELWLHISYWKTTIWRAEPLCNANLRKDEES